MITVRQHCVRCEHPIDYHKVNESTGVYSCSQCDSVSSIYEERSFKLPTTATKPDNVEVSMLGNSLYIDVKGLQVLVLNGPLGWILMISLCSAIFSTCWPTTDSVKVSIWGAFFIIAIIIVVYANYLQKRRITRIEIDPYTLEIYQLDNGEKLPYNNLSLSTFMIDQVYVHQYEKVDRDSDTGKVTSRYLVYELRAWMKDMCEETLLLQERSPTTYQYVEKVIEEHLGIRDREMSRGV